MVHIKGPLLLSGKSNPCSGSIGFFVAFKKKKNSFLSCIKIIMIDKIAIFCNNSVFREYLLLLILFLFITSFVCAYVCMCVCTCVCVCVLHSSVNVKGHF